MGFLCDALQVVSHSPRVFQTYVNTTTEFTRIYRLDLGRTRNPSEWPHFTVLRLVEHLKFIKGLILPRDNFTFMLCQ